jgi:hypothetical protein
MVFEGLDSAGALRRCSCTTPFRPLLDEEEFDNYSAYVLHALVRRDALGGAAQGMFPKTYRALEAAREAVKPG